MQRTGAMESATSAFRKIFPIALLLCLAASGCHNTCVSGFWNGTASGIRVSSNTSCTFGKATGAVVVQMSTASATPAVSTPTPSPLASSRNVQHVFITLRGIEAHTDVVAEEDAPGWQELAPDLVAHPIQLDLMALTAESRSPSSLASTKVPAIVLADEYRQLRLRFVPLHASPDDLIPESNACGNVGWNCVVFTDGSVRPLVFSGAAPEFHVHSEPSAESLFRVLPDAAMQLTVEFDPYLSAVFPTDRDARLAPAFRIRSRLSFPAVSAP